MAEPRGTQIKNLPRVDTLDGSDVLVKQKTLPNNSATQGITVDNAMNYISQQLSMPQILQDIADLQQQITTIIQKSDVADIVNCYDNEGDASKTDIVHYDTTTLSNNDIIEVLEDETHSDSVSYYKYNATTNTFTYIGSLAPYYNKTEIDDKLLLINNDIANIVNRIATLENRPHLIYSNYATRPYYEVYSNGMCRQWSMPDANQSSSAFTENTTINFAIPYKNTKYLLYPVGFDVSNVGAQQVSLSTTGFTTSSMITPCGTRCWVAYGEVDLSQISNYI